ncbi:MAG: transporter, partial [Myxococcales bacterium]
MPTSAGSRVRALLAALALAAPGVAAAQSAPQPTSRALDIELFQPGPGRYDLPGLYSSRVQGHLTVHGGLLYNASVNPLTAGAEGNELRLVASRHTVDVLAALGLFDRVELGVAIPVTLRQYSDAYNPVTFQPVGELETVTALQDVRLVPKVRIWDSGGLAVAAVAPVFLPTGRRDLFLAQGFGAAPMAVVDYSGENWKVGVNAGLRFRGRQQFLGLVIGNEFVWSLGGQYRIPVTGDEMPLAAWAAINGRIALSRANDTALTAGSAPTEA